MAATAKRKDLRVISVVIGEETSANRFEDVRTMFDYAFANYSNQLIAEVGIPLEQCVSVFGGKQKSVAVYPMRSVFALQQKGQDVSVKTEIILETVKAPIEKGEKVGELLVFRNGIEVDRIPLLAAEDVKRANFFDCLQEIAENWNKR